MKEIILTIGISNSGKSTWAKEFIAANPDYVEVNRDEIRIEHFCDGGSSRYNTYVFNSANERKVSEIALVEANMALIQGKSIIISDTNLNPRFRGEWAYFANNEGIKYSEKVFNTPLGVCLERNAKRDITIPEHVLLRQHKAFIKGGFDA